MDRNVFFIGMNRTGTQSLCETFRRGLALHDPKWWYFRNKAQFKVRVYTDGYEGFLKGKYLFPDLDLLETFFPGSLYVLNTRNIGSWMASRLKTGKSVYFLNLKKTAVDDEVMFNWISARNQWYEHLLQFFKPPERAQRLLKINLENDGAGQTKKALFKFLHRHQLQGLLRRIYRMPWANRSKGGSEHDRYVRRFLETHEIADGDLVVRLKEPTGCGFEPIEITRDTGSLDEVFFQYGAHLVRPEGHQQSIRLRY